MNNELNLFYQPLKNCINNICNYYITDQDITILCIEVSEELRNFFKKRGYFYLDNLQDGDRCCLCVYKWLDAYNAGIAPKIIPESTNVKVLNYIPMDILSKYF